MVKTTEQIQADMLRVLFKLGLIPDDEFHRLIDILQIKLFERQGYLEKKTKILKPIKV